MSGVKKNVKNKKKLRAAPSMAHAARSHLYPHMPNAVRSHLQPTFVDIAPFECSSLLDLAWPQLIRLLRPGLLRRGMAI